LPYIKYYFLVLAAGADFAAGFLAAGTGGAAGAFSSDIASLLKPCAGNG
jgi:hypothetical protein